MSPDKIQAAQATATATLVATDNGRLRGVYVRSTAVAGTAIFKDGGASGTVVLTINTPAVVGAHYHDIPGPGIGFGTDLHVTLANADGVTAYYVTDSNAAS